jgi:hypothetical protein
MRPFLKNDEIPAAHAKRISDRKSMKAFSVKCTLSGFTFW